jgi:hypothetical protein
MIKISVAGLNVRLNNKYSFIEQFSKDYITSSDGCDIAVEASEAELELEARQAPADAPRGYLESIVLYRAIAEQLPNYSAFVFHGAVIAKDGKAYAVTARSGVGKTTHLRLWLDVFGEDVHILNGDKPILRIIDGKVYACATPWRGKEGYGIPEMLPLCGIGFLERGEVNVAEKITVGDALMRFVSQIYIPKNKGCAAMALNLADKVLSSVPLYKLSVNMENDAAIVACNAFCGENDKVKSDECSE